MGDISQKKSRLTPQQRYRRVIKRLRSAERTTVRHTQKYVVRRLSNIQQARKQIILVFVALGLALSGVLTQYFVFSNQYSVEAAVDGGTYAEGMVGTIDTLDPLFASSNAEVAARELLFSSLYSHDQSGTLHPDVAQSMVVSEDSKEYTVTMRNDVRWHDGELLTAHDVSFTIATIQNPAANVNASLRANWASITTEVVDDYTIKFILPNRYAAFPEALIFPIIPRHILEGTPANIISESDFVTNPVGSGPFKYKLLQVVDDTSAKKILYLTANNQYYGGAPRLARYELHTYSDNETLIQALKKSEVIAIADADLTDVSLDDRKFVTQYIPVDSGVYLMFNMKNEILKDVNVRRAIRSAINTTEVREAAGQGSPELYLPFLQDQISAELLPKAPLYSVEQANKLLDAAGWKTNGSTRSKDSQQLSLRITTVKGSQNDRVAQNIQKQLAQVGVTVTVESIDINAPGVNFVQNVLQARNFDILIGELPVGADPDVYPYWHSSQMGVSGYNFTDYANDVSDAALTSARDRLEKRLRDAKYATFAKQWLSDAPAVGLYQQTMSYVTGKNVVSLDSDTILVTTSERYDYVDRWTVDRATVYKTP